MYVCMYVCIYIYTYIFMCVYINTDAYAHTPVNRFLNEPVLVIPFPASASAAKAMSETVDPLRWSARFLLWV